MCPPQATQALTLRLSAKIEFYNFSWTFICAPLEQDKQQRYLRDNMLFPLLAVNQELCRQVTKLKVALCYVCCEPFFIDLLPLGVDCCKGQRNRRLQEQEREDPER